MEVICFFCNEQTDDWRRNFTELKSQHSNTPIVDFLNRFLDDFKSQRNIEDISNCICTKCLDRIDDYDWMCVSCSEKENQLKELLLATEKLHISRETVLIAEPKYELHPDVPMPTEVKIESGCEVNASEENHTSQPTADLMSTKNALNLTRDIRIKLIPTKQMCREPVSNSNSEVRNKRKSLNRAQLQTQPLVESHEEYNYSILFEDNEDLSTVSCIVPKFKARQVPSSNVHNSQISETPLKLRIVEPKANIININRADDKGIIQEKVIKTHTERVQREPAKNNESVSSTYSRACVPCKRYFLKPNFYEAHMNRHQRTCELCNIVSPSMKKHTLHMQQHQIPKSFVCPICNLKLANESEHREHLELHEGKPDIQCAICNKIYKTKSHLKAHIKCHGNRDLLCDICGAHFYDSFGLKVHRKLHFDEKKFECAYCSKAFKVKSYLRVHMRIHASTERPFACSFCDMRFKRKDHWQVHEKRHRENTKTEKCTICPAAFEHKFYLKQHMEKRHRTVKPQETI